MPTDQQQHPAAAFWDFIQSSNPGQAPGQGVDHNNQPTAPPFPDFPGSFPFAHRQGPPGPTPPQPPHPPAPPGHAAPPGHPAGAGPWDTDFSWGPGFHHAGHNHWGRRGGHRGRHAHGEGGRRGDGEQSRHEHGASHDEKRDLGVESVSDSDRDVDNEKGESPDTMRVDDPAEVVPGENEAEPSTSENHNRAGRGFGGGRGRCRRGHGGPFGSRRGGPHGHRGNQPFDFGGMFQNFMNHPYMQNFRDQANRPRGDAQPANQTANTNESDVFSPPVDLFNTERAYVLHVALPGAKKENIDVNWDPDNSAMNISGIVLRPGDEQFLQTLSSGERTVGVFERSVTLPPAGADEKEDIDGFSITAKMEDGVLVVTVPKMEKEWTEIRKVDIE